jgi:hypothetical protein
LATWTTPKTWTNAAVTSAEFNAHIRDNETWLKGAFTQLNVTSDSAKAKITPALMGARAYKGADQTLTTAVQTAVTLDNESFDSDAFHDNAVNNTRFTIPASSAGYYMVGATVLFASNNAGRRIIWLYAPTGLTGGTYFAANEMNSTSTGGSYVTTAALVQLAAADYIELVAYQNSGGNLNITSVADASPVMWIHRISST